MMPSECYGSSTDTKPTRGIRLCGASHFSVGNVFYNGQPVCDDEWDDNDAKVVCRMIGYQTGEAISSFFFGDVTTNFIINNVRCTGNETNLFHCPHTSKHDCGSG